ncbi:MAG: FtsW/RodA/SpoVE family cell cycle protein, partial [Planctomycetota bacterium]
LRAWWDPYRDPQGIGYHVIQSMTTVAGGGLAGRGLGNGVQKFGYLPEDTTDFIFAVVCEEMGLVGATVVVGLFGGLLLCGWAIIRRTSDPFCRLLGLGILLTVGLQTLINLAVVTGWAPTKGIALPLVSAGGTGWVLTAFSLGLLVSIGREADQADERRATAVCVCP